MTSIQTKNTGRSIIATDGSSINRGSYASHKSADDVKIPPILTRIYNQMHHGLFGLLFALQRKSKGTESPIWIVFLEIFEMLQLLSFPFKRAVHFPWNGEHTGWWITFVNYSVPETLILGNSPIFYVVIVILGLVLSNAFVVGYYFSQNQYKFVWTLRYLRGICTLFMTILYIPVIALFTSMVFDCGEHSCWASAYAVRSVVVILLSFTYIALTMTFALAVFQQDPTDRSEILGRPHSRIEFLQIVVKTVLTIIFVALEHGAQYQWLLVALCLLGSGSLFLANVWFIPLYKWKFNLLRVTIMGNFLWASVCLVIVKALDDYKHNSVTIMYFLVLPGIVALSVYALNLRKAWVTSCVISANTNPCTVELKARFLLEKQGLLFKGTKEDGDKSALESADEKVNKEFLAHITDMYADAAALLPNSSILYMFWSNFCLYHCKNKQRSLVVLAECIKRNPLIDEEFVVFRQRKIMNEESSDNTDMLEFIICEAYVKRALKHQRKALVHQVQFWSELTQVSIDLQKLFLLGSAVNAEVSVADMNYSRALHSAPKSSSVMRSYSQFLSNVCNDTKKSVELMERARQLEDLRRRANAMNGDTMDLTTIMTSGSSDASTAIFTINHHGHILSANAGVKALFGYEKPQLLVGQNVNVIVPPPFSKVHDSFLTRFLNVGEGQIISKLRKIFAVRADGYLFPVMLLVRQLTFGTAATFLGIFKAVPEGTQANDYIVIDTNGYIKCFTLKCTEYFGNTPADVNRYQMQITDWIENFDEVSDSMKGGSQHRVELELQDKVVELAMSMITTTIAGLGISIIKIVDAMSKVDEQEAGGIKAQMPMDFYVDIEKVKRDKKAAVLNAATAKDPPADKLKEKKSTDHDKAKDRHKKHHAADKHKEKKSSDEKAKDDARLVEERRQSIATTTSEMTGDGESQRTADTGTSATSATMNTIMRSAFNKKIEHSIKRLNVLKRALLVLLIATGLLAIITNALISKNFKDYVKHIDDIKASGNNIVNSLDVLQRLRYFQQNRGSMSSTARKQERDSLFNTIYNISEYHYDLFNTSAMYSKDIADMFTHPNLSISVDSNAGTKLTNLTFNDGVSAFIAKVTGEVEDLASDSPKNTLAFGSIASVVFDTLLEPMHTLVLKYLYSQKDTISGTVSYTYVLSTVPIAIINLICLAVICAIFYRTSMETKVLYGLFLDIPKDVIVSMRVQCTKHLSSMDVMDDDQVRTGSDADSKVNSQLENLFNVVQHSVENLNLNAMSRGGKNISAVEGASSGGQFLKLKKLLTRLSLFVILTGFYFIGFATHSQLFFTDHRAAGSSLAWASFTSGQVQEVHFRTMMLLANDSFSEKDTNFADKFNNLRASVIQLETYAKMIVLGSDTFKLHNYVEEMRVNKSVTEKSARLTAIVYDSAGEILLSSPQCQSHDKGILQSGLYNSLYHYLDTLRDVIAAVESGGYDSSLVRYDSYAPTLSVTFMARECFLDYFSAFTDQHYASLVEEATLIDGYVHVSATCLLIIALGLLYNFVFKRLMRSIEREVALTPSMLLMLPSQVLMKVEKIKAFTMSTK